MWFETNLSFLCCELSTSPLGGEGQSGRGWREEVVVSAVQVRGRCWPCLTKVTLLEDLSRFGQAVLPAETTRGSWFTSVSIMPRKQGCHGAALALFQSILASKHWGPCSLLHPPWKDHCHPARWGETKALEQSARFWGYLPQWVLCYFPCHEVAGWRESIPGASLCPLGRAYQQLLVCVLAWQGDECLTAWLPMGF